MICDPSNILLLQTPAFTSLRISIFVLLAVPPQIANFANFPEQEILHKLFYSCYLSVFLPPWYKNTGLYTCSRAYLRYRAGGEVGMLYLKDLDVGCM